MFGSALLCSARLWSLPCRSAFVIVIMVAVKSSESNNKVSGMRQKQKQTLNSNGFLSSHESFNVVVGVENISPALLLLTGDDQLPTVHHPVIYSLRVCVCGGVESVQIDTRYSHFAYRECFGNERHCISIIHHKIVHHGHR